jgi:hypothetical protein
MKGGEYEAAFAKGIFGQSGPWGVCITGNIFSR